MLNGDGALITEDGTRGPTRVKLIKHVLQGRKYWDGTADDGVVVAVGAAGIKTCLRTIGLEKGKYSNTVIIIYVFKLWVGLA